MSTRPHTSPSVLPKLIDAPRSIFVLIATLATLAHAPAARAIVITPSNHLEVGVIGCGDRIVSHTADCAQALCDIPLTVDEVATAKVTSTLTGRLFGSAFFADLTTTHQRTGSCSFEFTGASATSALAFTVPANTSINLSVSGRGFGSYDPTVTSVTITLTPNDACTPPETICSFVTACDQTKQIGPGDYKLEIKFLHGRNWQGQTGTMEFESSIQIFFNEAVVPGLAQRVRAGGVAGKSADCRPEITVDAPTGGVLTGGENFTIRWSAPTTSPVDVVLVAPGADPEPLAIAVPATPGELLWSVPTTRIVRNATILVTAIDESARSGSSAPFTIRPYVLARRSRVIGVDDDEVFNPDHHGWPLINSGSLFTEAQYWPWRPEFDYYAGEDPFTHVPYPPARGAIDLPTRVFTDAGFLASQHQPYFPDWPSYVRTFGKDRAYFFLGSPGDPLYVPSFVEQWGRIARGGFRGSCLGMVASAMAAFGHPEAFGARFPEIGLVEQLMDIPLGTRDDVDDLRRVVNSVQAYDAGTALRERLATLIRQRYQPRDVLRDLKAMLLSDDRSNDRLLGMLALTPTTVGHQLVPYEMERIPNGLDGALLPCTEDPRNCGDWRVYVYDPNQFTSDVSGVNRYHSLSVRIDSVGNQWEYGSRRGTRAGLYLLDPIPNYLVDGVPLNESHPRAATRRSTISDTLADSQLYITVPPGAQVRLVAPDGSVCGFSDSAAVEEIPEAVAHIPFVGGFSPPVGFFLPSAHYQMDMTAYPDPNASVSVVDGGRVYGYDRRDAAGAQSDHLEYNSIAGLRAGTRDVGPARHADLTALTVDAGRERVFELRSVGLAGSDSVGVLIADDPAGPRLRIVNGGGGKTYQLLLQGAGLDGVTRFRHDEVPLPAGASHVVRPNWARLEDPVAVDVDLDGDTVTDLTLSLNDETTAALLSLVSATAEPGVVRLRWLASEPGIRATIYRADRAGEWSMIGEVTADGTGNIMYEDGDVTPGGRYGYRLGVRHGDDEETFGEVWVDVPSQAAFALTGARPNPTSDELTVAFSLPDASPARLELLDLAGRLVLARDVGGLGAGSHVTRLGESGSLPAGIYMIRLTAKAGSRVIRAAVVR